jgi:hypothetical protein
MRWQLQRVVAKTLAVAALGPCLLDFSSFNAPCPALRAQDERVSHFLLQLATMASRKHPPIPTPWYALSQATKPPTQDVSCEPGWIAVASDASYPASPLQVARRALYRAWTRTDRTRYIYLLQNPKTVIAEFGTHCDTAIGI